MKLTALISMVIMAALSSFAADGKPVSYKSGDETAEYTTRDDDIGDIEAGFYYHLVQEREGVPDVVVNLKGKSRTGKDPYDLKKKKVKFYKKPTKEPFGWHAIIQDPDGHLISIIQMQQEELSQVPYYHGFAPA